MKGRILLLLLLVFGYFPISLTHGASSCIRVIQYAENNTTGECQAFSTPCDVPTGWTKVTECTLTSSQKNIEPKFDVKKFASCEDMESKLLSIMKRYQSNYWYPYPLMYAKDAKMEEMRTTSAVMEKSANAPAPTVAPVADATSSVAQGGVSTTNIQVLGVDEADSVKTDGKYIYTYSEESREVRIASADSLTSIANISLPETFSSVNLYVQKGRLVVVGTKYVYTTSNWSYRWYPPETKSIVAVYNLKDPKKPVLERFSQIDGDLRESRLI
jgi:uncharacterized secreted protein with C-terminal beta-propeller domain